MSTRVDVVHVKAGDPPPWEVATDQILGNGHGHALARHATVLEAGTKEGSPTVILDGQIIDGEHKGKWISIELTGRTLLGIAASVVVWEPAAANNLAGFEAVFPEGDPS